MSESLKLNIGYRQILQMSLPISFAILVPQFNFLINSFFLAQLGPGNIGASGITGVYYLIFSAIGFGLNNGLQALISRRGGQDREKEIGTLFIQSIYITLCIAFVGIVLTYTVAPLIFERNTDPALFQKSMGFLYIRIWGLPFLYLYQMRNGLLVGTNQSKLLIWGTLAETISNVFLDYVLIFGKWGFPELGFNGAAYASVCAEFIGMLVVLIAERYILRKKNYKLSRIWLIESIILLLILSSYLLSNSKFYYKVSDNVQWFVIIQSNDKTDKQVKYSFPNNRIMQIDTNDVFRVR